MNYRLITTFVLCAACAGIAAPPADFQPDPITVQRHGPAYRYPQAGWIVLHIEGAPHERGVQHGALLAPEIAAYVRCFASTHSSEAPADAWTLVRTLTRSLFLPHFDKELIEEMQGIADGAASEGAAFDDRPIDLIDIAALNLWAEMMTLDSAAQAVPTGLEGIDFPRPKPRPITSPDKGHCSAFAATAPATADGKIVFGHISMFDLYPSSFFNVWIDLQPGKGNRITMQSYPAGIYSGMDYYVTSAGMLVCETTIAQTRLNVSGETLSSRMRRAVQYGDSIDAIAKILTGPGNGLYTNEWLLADTKTNEIAMLELGTQTHKLWRSTKGEWFGDTTGFYWGCNNVKDRDVRLETIASTSDRPEQMVWSPSDRDKAWLDFYKRYKGKIDESFARDAFTSPPLCAFPSVDAKYTTTDLARSMTSWAVFGPPAGKTWQPTTQELRKYSEIAPLVSNSWTVMKPIKPETSESFVCTDIPAPVAPPDLDEKKQKVPVALPAWHGTVFPASDSDIWLAISFSEFERIIAKERGMIVESGKACLCDSDKHKAAASLGEARSQYALAAATKDAPLSQIHPEFDNDHWRHLAGGKGILVLNELRMRIGDDEFRKMMNEFGLANAGKKITTQDFATHVERFSKQPMKEFFNYWTEGAGLPSLAIKSVRVQGIHGDAGKNYRVEAKIEATGGPLPPVLELTLETDLEDETAVVKAGADGSFSIESDVRPVRLIVDKFGRTAKANGTMANVCSFMDDLPATVIVAGTRDDEAANREAAFLLEKRIAEFWSNFHIPVISDRDADSNRLSDKHIILVGRPSTNSIAKQFEAQFPVTFGRQSVTVGRERFGNASTALCIAGDHPNAKGKCLTIIAGLSGPTTYRACDTFLTGRDRPGGQVIALESGKESRSIAVPAPDLARELPAP